MGPYITAPEDNKPDIVALIAQQVEESPFATAITRENIVIYANRQFRAESLRDKQIENPVGMSLVDLEYGATEEEFSEMRAQWKQGNAYIRRTDYEFNGTKYAELLSTSRIRYGGVNYLVGTSVDISVIKDTETALEDALERLEKAQSLAKIGDFVSSIDSREFNGSAEAMRILGFEAKPATISTMQLFDHFHPDDKKRVIEITNGLQSSGYFQIEHRLKPELGGERWVYTQASVERDDKAGVLLVRGTVQDVTARKQAETEKANFERKMQETQKLESLGVLAGGIAHDFNNLLAGILGNADFALLSENIPAEVESRLQDIVTASRRAADLTRQLLAYSGKGRFVIEPVALNQLIREMTELIKVTISRDHDLRFFLADDLPLIEVDATQIRQIVMNLVLNAAEAIEHQNGMVNITTGLQHCDPAYLQASELSSDITPGDYVYFEVSDNGSGMDATTLAKIYEPFFTTKFTGRGLGLAAALGIARGHRGAIKIYTEPGQGTTFKILLPVANSEVVAVDEGRPVASARGSGVVLIIDDDETVSDFTANVLRHYGYKVLVSHDGVAGIEVFTEHIDQIQLVLLDLTMPKMDGKETYARLRMLKPVPTILMSGYNEQDATQYFVGKGLAGFLPKPFLVKDLLNLVKEKIER